MVVLSEKRMFPCPVCMQPREIRLTKKDKPYVICDPCGVQVFVRGPAGVAEFDRLVERTSGEGVIERLKEMVRLYRLTCSQCGNSFWIHPELIKTSAFDGSLKGFRCPHEACGTIVPWGKEQ